MTCVLRAVVAIVRAWTKLYTLGLPSSEQSRRREAIDSDIWEFLHDLECANDRQPARHILGRAIRGVPDDLRWRVAHTETSSAKAAALLIAVMLLVAMRFISTGISLPPVPSAQAPVILTLDVPPPPPPPPEKQGGRHDRDYWRTRP